jgi:hypothetical protein
MNVWGVCFLGGINKAVKCIPVAISLDTKTKNLPYESLFFFFFFFSEKLPLVPCLLSSISSQLLPVFENKRQYCILAIQRSRNPCSHGKACDVYRTSQQGH